MLHITIIMNTYILAVTYQSTRYCSKECQKADWKVCALCNEPETICAEHPIPDLEQ